MRSKWDVNFLLLVSLAYEKEKTDRVDLCHEIGWHAFGVRDGMRHKWSWE
jgi:hypothetical protein